MTGKAGHARVGGGLWIFLPLPGDTCVGAVGGHGQDLVEVKGEFLATSGSLGLLGQAAEKLAAQVERELFDNGFLLLPHILIGVIAADGSTF